MVPAMSDAQDNSQGRENGLSQNRRNSLPYKVIKGLSYLLKYKFCVDNIIFKALLFQNQKTRVTASIKVHFHKLDRQTNISKYKKFNIQQHVGI